PLSADPERALIGDDEHGWSDQGVFNFEGGCYAKVIRLSREAEPEIYATTRMFGTVLENVVVDPETRAVDLESAAITENTRASYPIHFIPNHVTGGVAGHPSHLVFLTCEVDGGAVRRRPAHAPGAHPRHGARRARGHARPDSDRARAGVRARSPAPGAGRPRRSTAAARHVARPRGVRRGGGEALPDVSAELRAVPGSGTRRRAGRR